MSLLRKLRPVKLDQLIYVITSDDEQPQPEAKFSTDRSQIRFTRKNKQLATYRLLIDAAFVHKSNVFYNTHFLKTIGKFGAPVIGDCHTDNAFRGKGIYPYMLVHIYRELLTAHKEIYILVSPENAPSIRGIEKAGFRKVARVKTTRLGPFYLNKKVLN